jgi:hypothetical protein
MVLIHMFTHSFWLSTTGELLTYVFALSFHFTKETMWELLETTFLAIISSFYMISMRKQVMMERDGLSTDIDSLRERGAILLRNIHQIHEALREHEMKNPGSMRDSVMVQVKQEQDQLKEISKQGSLLASSIKKTEDSDSDTDIESAQNSTLSHKRADDTELTRQLLKEGECSCSIRTFQDRLNNYVAPFKEETTCKKIKCYRETFFEYFLDGAAGKGQRKNASLLVFGASTVTNSLLLFYIRRHVHELFRSDCGCCFEVRRKLLLIGLTKTGH